MLIHSFILYWEPQQSPNQPLHQGEGVLRLGQQGGTPTLCRPQCQVCCPQEGRWARQG